MAHGEVVLEGSHGVVALAAREPASDEWAWLFDHQPDVVEAVAEVFTAQPGSRRKWFRAQVHLAPGLGKTRIGFMVRERVAAQGGMLFAVPTRSLLEQTYKALREYGWRGPVVAVYSPRDAALAGREGEGVRVTTSPRELAVLVHRFRAAGVPYTVLTTYASVEAVIAAHRLQAERDGVESLPAWDLLVKDEAHHTESSAVWGRINSQRLVPAVRRLAMTATPRLMGLVKRDKRGRIVVTPGVRMSEKMHGPVVYRMGLSEAQRRGKLARSRVVVAEVGEERLRVMVDRLGRGDAGVQAELMTSASGAVLRAAGRYGCRRVLAYHRTVAGAVAAAGSMAEQSRLLHEQGTSAPARVFAVALHEETPAREREAALDALRAGTDLDQNEVDLVVVCSVRVLNEGIDVPRVDGVALVEPRTQPHELLQIAGRALRFDRDNPEKIANIIVPVIHLEGPVAGAEDDDAEIGESSDWDPVTNMLRAVESYEPDGGPPSFLEGSTSRTRPVIGVEEQRERQERRARELADMLVLTRERSSRAVVDWLRFTVVNDPVAGDLLKVMEAAAAFRQEHLHLRVPADWEEDGLLLAVELDKLRRRARRDREDLARLVEQKSGDASAAREEWLRRGPRIHPDDLDRLAGMGFEWGPRADGRALLLAAARAYTAAHGHLLPGRNETIDLGGEEVPIGAMLTELRRPGVTDTELDAIGEWRLPPEAVWTAVWHRQLVRLRLFRAEGGRRAELLAGPREFRGSDLGKWLQTQHVRWKDLAEAQRAALKDLRMGPAAGDARVHAAGVPQARRSRTERAMELVLAARQYLEEVGPLVDEAGRIIVADSYRPVVAGREVQLRKRLYPVRDGYDSYPPELQDLFHGLGLPWVGEAHQPEG
ncbi:DEAD/DEAH box helicase family protein [Streptomyces blastmyceticus]|uniref:DEAD/DEAH box helicase n=1 Tax=Streptomyces blastmyceticus TaxID=68180 RepID=A0ABP3HQA4_9ACTN